MLNLKTVVSESTLKNSQNIVSFTRLNEGKEHSLKVVLKKEDILSTKNKNFPLFENPTVYGEEYEKWETSGFVLFNEDEESKEGIFWNKESGFNYEFRIIVDGYEFRNPTPQEVEKRMSIFGDKWLYGNSNDDTIRIFKTFSNNLTMDTVVVSNLKGRKLDDSENTVSCEMVITGFKEGGCELYISFDEE